MSIHNSFALFPVPPFCALAPCAHGRTADRPVIPAFPSLLAAALRSADRQVPRRPMPRRGVQRRLRRDGWSLREIQTQSSLVAGRSRWANGEEVKSGVFDWLLVTEFHLPRRQVNAGRGRGQDTHLPDVPSPPFPLLFGSAFAEYPRLGRVSK